MADEVRIPINLEVTDLDLTNVDTSNIEKDLSSKMKSIQKTLQDSMKSIDTTNMTDNMKSAVQELHKGFDNLRSAQEEYSKSLKATDEEKTAKGMMSVDEAAEKLVEAFESLNTVYQNFNKVKSDESTLTQEYRDAFEWLEKLRREMEFYKKMAESANINDNVKSWQNLDANVKATSEIMKTMLANLREMVRTGEAFKLGAGTQEDVAQQKALFRSMQGSMSSSMQSANYRIGLAGGIAPEELIQAKEKIKELEVELDLTRRKYEEMTSSGEFDTTSVIEMGARVEELNMQLERAEQEFYNMAATASAPTAGIYETAAATEEMASSAEEASSSFEDMSDKASMVDELLVSMLEVVAELAETVKDIELKLPDDQKMDDHQEKVKETKNEYSQLHGTLEGVRMGLMYVGLTGSSMIGKMVSAAMLLENAYRDVGAAAQSIIPVVGIFISIGLSAFSKIISLVKTLVHYLGQVASFIWDIAKSVGSTLLGAVTKLGSKLKDIISNLKPSGKLLKNLFQTMSKYFLGFRSTYFLIRKVRQVIIDGMKDIAAQSPEVNEVLSNFTTELNHLKGLLVAAFQPVLSFVLPVLTRLMAALARVLTLITKFLAVLTGQDYYYDYVATMQDYAKGIDAVGKAAKKAKRDLMGFDEINRLSDTDNGGSAGALPIGDWKKSMLDMDEAISKFAQMVREAWAAGGQFTEVGRVVGLALSSLLDRFNNELLPGIDNFLTKFTNSIATFINGFVSVEGLGDKIGTTFANILNTIIKAIDNFLTTVEWDKVGIFIGDIINGWFGNFNWSQFFTTIAHLFNSIFTFLYNAAVTVQWRDIGMKIASGLIDGLKEFDAATAGKACYEVVKGLLDMLLGWLDKMNEIDSETGKTGWQILGDKIKEFFENFKFNDVAKEAGECVGKLLGGLADAILEADPDGTTFTGAIDSFFEGLEGTDYKTKLETLWENTIKPAILKLWDWLKPKIKAALAVVLDFIGEALKEAIELYKGGFKDAFWDSFMPSSSDKGYGESSGFFGSWIDGLAKKYNWGADEIENATDKIDQSMSETSSITRESAETMAVSTESAANSISVSAESISASEGIMRESAETAAASVQESNEAVQDSSEKTAKNVGGAYKSVQQAVTTSINPLPGEVQKSMDEVSGSVLNTIKPEDVNTKYSGFWNTISGVFENTPNWFKDKFSSAYTFITNAFSNVGSWATGIFDKIKEIFQVIPDWFSDKFSSAFVNVKSAFSNVSTWALGVWNTIKEAFKVIPEWFKNTFSDAWENVKKVFSSGGQVFQGIQTGLFETMKRVINSLIDGLNAVIVKPFEALNNTLRGLKSVDILGVKPFSWIGTISVPKIPKLAKGAVLPPNSPFLSIVGDQKQGTNVEAPLDTIKQAVAEVMTDNYEGMMAGFEAVVQAIQNKDLNVKIGDKEIGQASNRYNQSELLRRGYA